MKIDISKHLGLVTREVTERDREGRVAQVVKATRTYPTDIEDVWDALTNPERLPRWFLPVSGDLKLGGRYQIKGNASGEITACERPRLLAVTWEFGGDTSWVQVALTAVDAESTRLELEHAAHTPKPFWDDYGPGAAGVGWDLALVGLGEHLWGGADVDHAEAEQWPATDDGRKFVAHCSDGWCEASISMGTDPTAAKAAAGRTIAFYTGVEEPSGSD